MVEVLAGKAVITSGDSVVVSVVLRKDGVLFVPGEDYDLLFSAKEAQADVDADSAFQKDTGAGITVDGHRAYLDIVYADTSPYKDVTLYCGITAQHVTTGARHTVAKFLLEIQYDPSFEVDASIDIYTRAPAAASGLRMFYWEPENEDTITAAAGVNQFHLITGESTLADLDFQFPELAGCANGQQFMIYSSITVSAVNWIYPDGSTVIGTVPGGIAALSTFAFIFNTDLNAFIFLA